MALTSYSDDVQEPIDGDLAAQVLGLLQVCDAGVHGQRVEEHSRQRLDIALLGFFQSFRKVYVGEQVMTCSKVSNAFACCRSYRSTMQC